MLVFGKNGIVILGSHLMKPSGTTYKIDAFTAIEKSDNLVQYSRSRIINAELKCIKIASYLWLIDSFGNVPIDRRIYRCKILVNNSRKKYLIYLSASILDM